MKHKNFLKILALVLVIVMSVGVLTACDKGSKEETTTTETTEETGTKYLTETDAQSAFISTMFSSANKIGQGVTVNTEAGNDIALNLGLTLTISKDGKQYPISLYIKGFIDRQNVEGSEGNYTMTDTNSTVIDIAVKANGIDSGRIYFKMNEGHGIIYGTLAGTKVKVDLSNLGKINGTQKVEDYLFNLFEDYVVQNEIVAGIASAFSGTNFDLNTLLSSFVNELLGKEGKSLADILLSINDKKVKTVINTIFGKDEEIEQTLGSTIDVEGLLKKFGKLLFSDPVWTINGRTFSGDNYARYVVYHANEELTASFKLCSSAVNIILSDLPLKNISIGFKKGAGTSATDLGKMEEFYIDLNFNNINGNGKVLGVKIAITDLVMGSTSDLVTFDEPKDEEYNTSFSFDMGFDLTADADFMNMIVRELDENTNLKVIVGGDKLEIDIDNDAIVFPEKIKLNIAGTIDLFNADNTAVILKVLTQDNINPDNKDEKGMDTAMKVQIYGSNSDLVADVRISDEYVSIVDSVLDIIYSFKQKQFGPLGIDWNSETSSWEFNTAGSVGDTLSNFVDTGCLRIEGLNLATLINNLLEGSKKLKVYDEEYSAASAASDDYIADKKAEYTSAFSFLLPSLLGNKNGIILALYKIIGVSDTAITIGSQDIVATVMNALFSVTDDDGNSTTFSGNVGSYVGISSFISMIKDFEFLGNSLNVIDEYKSFEELAVKTLCEGIKINSTRTIYFERGDEEDATTLLTEYNNSKTTDARKTEIKTALANMGYSLKKDSSTSKYVLVPTTADKYIVEINKLDAKDDASTISTYTKALQNYGYAVIKDTNGAYVTYPKTLYTYYKDMVDNCTTANQAKVNAELAKEYLSCNWTTKELIATPASELLTKLNTELQGCTSSNRDESSFYLKKASVEQILVALLRIGTQAVPSYDGANWTVETGRVYFDEAILNNADLTVSIYANKDKTDTTKATRGGVKIVLNACDKDFTLDLYMNFDSAAGKAAKSKVESATDFYGEGKVPTQNLYIDYVAK